MITVTTIQFKEYLITTDKQLMKPEDIHRWLSAVAYWSKNISYETVLKSFENSYCAGVLIEEKQIGYARFITDYASFAYLADVYVEERHRGKGLSKMMMDILMGQDWVKTLRRIMLATVDAHALYEQYGFHSPTFPERLLEITRPGIYGDEGNPCR